MRKRTMNAPTKTPALVNWTGYLAITLLLALPLSVLIVRSGNWQQGLMIYAISCLGATALLALFVVLLMLPRYADWRGTIRQRAFFVLPGTVLLAVLLSGRGDYPPIHDITTDVQDPPEFSAAEQQRGPNSNSLAIKPDYIEQQQQAYPDLKTLRTELDIDSAFDRALLIAQDLGWEVYLEDLNAGVMEAVDTTAIMAFKDDVAIRLRTDADGTMVDLRSVSRVGIGDIGANAKRIRAFAAAFAQ
jgi:uncharacterized protein (DUF1499 family)